MAISENVSLLGIIGREHEEMPFRELINDRGVFYVFWEINDELTGDKSFLLLGVGNYRSIS